MLNPKCVIYGGTDTVSNGHDDDWVFSYSGKIVGYDGSEAERYAKENKYTFESLGAAPAAVHDLDGDGKLTVADLVMLSRFVAEDSTLTEAQISALLSGDPDCNVDGLVTASDVRVLSRSVAAVA